MKSTGVVRKMDDLGRVVIPMELRRTLEIEQKDGLEIFVDGDKIVLQKYRPGCSACGETEIAIELGKVKLCGSCAAKAGRNQSA